MVATRQLRLRFFSSWEHSHHSATPSRARRRRTGGVVARGALRPRTVSQFQQTTTGGWSERASPTSITIFPQQGLEAAFFANSGPLNAMQFATLLRRACGMTETR